MSGTNLVGPHQRGPIGARSPQSAGAASERKLWLSVLEAAWEDMRSLSESIRAASADWVQSDSYRVGSAAWLCDHLGLDLEAVRREWPKGKPGTVHGARWRRG